MRREIVSRRQSDLSGEESHLGGFTRSSHGVEGDDLPSTWSQALGQLGQKATERAVYDLTASPPGGAVPQPALQPTDGGGRNIEDVGTRALATTGLANKKRWSPFEKANLLNIIMGSMRKVPGGKNMAVEWLDHYMIMNRIVAK